MKYDYSLKLDLFFENPKDAQIILKVLSPELKRGFKRSKTQIKIKKGVLSINIKSVDATALKASISSYLKLINLSNNLLKGGKKQ